ncbi:flagellar FlbD family protein [Cohnella sp. JJ-181]|uniref:flagellar FlbD family protein n=1 Tax=Cohnella rhizoplanae TaxID=2974897 RepID=UPI0022FFA85B|nr:flagellar FlbD family protein [Cohnella sp. JJ-181]CAI6073168.1 hypothetical protein COHCIP112018_02375 [Cohnella sp. JJ-181]
MIKLTAPNGKTRYFAPELIVQVSEAVDETFVWIAHVEKAFTVREPAKKVVRKIMEYKMLTAQYPVYLQDALSGGDWGVVKKINDEIIDLAGMEADSK